MAEQHLQVQEPAFINYLLDPALDHDCYFLVGNKELGTAEKIGAVKKMLLAHSVVLRTELHESKMAEKGVVSIKDLYPDTFKNLLRYVYGFDNTASLSFDDADNLLYAAEKYLMTDLKNKLATLLMGLLTYENICTLMNNPACFRHLELDSAITKILQFQTDNVLASPQFLSLNPNAFIKILEQDMMNVSEVKVWRAALKWAKNRTASEDGEVLRKELTPHMKHIRLCTFSNKELGDKVVQTKILSDREYVYVCIAVSSKKRQADLTEICNTLERRAKPRVDLSELYIECMKTCRATFGFGLPFFMFDLASSSFTLLTKKRGLELLTFEFEANTHPGSMIPEGLTYQCDCTVTITRITDYINNTSTEPPVTVRFTEPVEYGKEFLVPITDNTGPVRLLPNNKYNIKVRFSTKHKVYGSKPLNMSPKNESEHLFVVGFQVCHGFYISPINIFNYKLLD